MTSRVTHTRVLLDLAAGPGSRHTCHDVVLTKDSQVARPIRSQLDSEGHLVHRSLSPDKGILEWG